MPILNIVDRDGSSSTVESDVGFSVMDILQRHKYDVAAICGGCCSCGTCHVRVHPDWLGKTGRATEAEQDLFDIEEGTDERSRLSCQVEMSDSLDGIVVEVAPF